MDDLEEKYVESFDTLYKTFYNPGVDGIRSWKPSERSIQEGLLWTFVILVLPTILLLSKRKSTKSSGKNRLPTPPGCNGWPLIGESYSFFHRENTAEFVHSRVRKYGEIFYTNILGGPHVLVHTPEFVRFMLVDPRHILRGELPNYVRKLFRPGHLINYHGQVHSEKYSLAMKSLSPKYHEPWIAGFNEVMRRTVDSWKGKTINCHDDSQKIFIDTGFVYIFGMVNNDKEVQERLSYDVQQISNALISFPINIPGSRYGRAMQARKHLNQFLFKKLEQHVKMREEGVKPQFYSNMEFFIDHREQTGKELSLKDEECVETILDEASTSLHAQFDTIPHLFAWLMKFLSENPEVLQQVKAEQDAIRSSKEGSDYTITGEDLAKMTYSNQVLQETLRMASIVGTSLRRVRTDFEYKGFIIPKDWTMHLGIRALHYNPNYFPDPYKFDPSRFQDPANIKPDTYVPFSFGKHGCLGKTMVKIQSLLLIHYVSTRLRWTPLDPSATIRYNPHAYVMGGYPIEVHAD